MPVIHFPNLRFEEELSGHPGTLRALPVRLKELTAELAVLVGLRAAPDDVVLVEPGGMPDAMALPDSLAHAQFLTLPRLRELLSATAGEPPSADWQLAPWGWSEPACRLLQLLRLQQTPPDPDAIRRVNTREFAAAFDVLISMDSTGLERRFSHLCFSEDEALAAIEQIASSAEDRWVIKANLSHAARNRLMGQGRMLSEHQRSWLSQRLRRSEPVSVEPWVNRLRECGLQWTVSGDSAEVRAEFDGAAEMLTDALGQYRGSLIGGGGTEAAKWWQPAVEYGHRVGQAAGKIGFRGPMGIDCMLIEYMGQQWLRPVHDINGRQTMGRLALSLERLLPAGFFGAWCHFPTRARKIEADFACNSLDIRVGARRTSPLFIGGWQPHLQTSLIIGDTAAAVTDTAKNLTQAVVPVFPLPATIPGIHP
jgi:hypothetical protein